jgi:signal transduction histidine kinase
LNIYTRKKRWKILLIILAIIIISASFFYTNLIVNQFAQEERKNVQLFAAAVQRKANLVGFTESFFNQLQEQENKRVEFLSKMYKNLLEDNESPDFTMYLEIVQNNKTIPIILTDDKGNINLTSNIENLPDTNLFENQHLFEEFTNYEPIEVKISHSKKHYLYYKDSKIFSELKEVLNDYITTFMSEVVLNSSSVPVIITDSTQVNVLQFGNLIDIKMSDPTYVQQKLEDMSNQNPPIKIDFAGQGVNYIFYQDSEMLTKMKYFPIAQILIISVFAFIAYLLFSFARKSEQNRVWAGMAKETAHQIGTPLSSIMAWMELLKMGEGTADQAADEIEKDIKRLEVITERFSKIGSIPQLENQNITETLVSSIEYLKKRTPRKVNYKLNFDTEKPVFIPFNAALFSWVIENLCKNAIDAMEGKGLIEITVNEDPKNLIIDISDTGKGIPTKDQKTIFNPGYTSKKRGWGLGLSLAKRIIGEYHKGKIFVKSSALQKGSVFRIILKK